LWTFMDIPDSWTVWTSYLLLTIIIT
jgi:hypothetical protein